MTTVRQIERAWNAKLHRRLSNDLLAQRPEASFGLGLTLSTPPAAAALALIRLDELGQSSAPICGQLVRAILVAQEADGGFGELPVTALCLRALLCCQGSGPAIDRGMAHLANLQKSDGIWPSVPLRRTAADPLISGFILYQLGNQPAFQDAVRFDEAIGWFTVHGPTLDADTAALWSRAVLRARRPSRPVDLQPMLSWS